jgi:hypothetical protein
MASYRRVARLQWRLVRAERALGLAWRTLKVRRQAAAAGRRRWARGAVVREAASLMS